jgi:hypothetical protein
VYLINSLVHKLLITNKILQVECYKLSDKSCLYWTYTCL